MSLISVEPAGDGTLAVRHPYSESLRTKWRGLRAVWAPPAWHIPERHRDVVLEALCAEYGWTPGCELVTVHVTFNRDMTDAKSLSVFGREVMRRPGRDQSVMLGDGVALIAGTPPGSGGSVKNPQIMGGPYTLEVDEVPRELAERHCAKYPEDSIVALPAPVTPPAPPVIVVTRHPALVELLRERGIVDEHARVIEHVSSPEHIAGAHVVGVIPLDLACVCERVTMITLALTPEDRRGHELSIERLREIAGEIRSYRVIAL